MSWLGRGGGGGLNRRGCFVEEWVGGWVGGWEGRTRNVKEALWWRLLAWTWRYEEEEEEEEGGWVGKRKEEEEEEEGRRGDHFSPVEVLRFEELGPGLGDGVWVGWVGR